MSTKKAYADLRAELAHSTGLLLTAPDNEQVAKALQGQVQQFTQQNQHDIKNQANQDLLKQAAKALSVHKIQSVFAQCLNKIKARETELGRRIVNAALNANFEADPCTALQSIASLDVLKRFQGQLKEKNLADLKNKSLEQSRKNLMKTFVYWERRIDKGAEPRNTEQICKLINCNESEKNLLQRTEGQVLQSYADSERKKTPKQVADFLNERKKSSQQEYKSQDELLLYTSALKDKNSITAGDVLSAQKEVTDLMISELKSVRSMDLNELIKTNPAALGQILLEHPEWTSLVCESIQQIVGKEESQAKWNEVYFWGGLVVGGTLLVTGVGAGVGALVLSGTAMAGTLTTVATASAIAGTALGVGDTLYSSSRSYLNSQEALSLRASSVSGNGDRKTAAEAQAKVEEAWSDLATAGIGAASLVPFGSLWRVMSKTAQVAKVGGAGQIARMTAAENEAAIRSLSQTIRELKDPDVEKILLRVQSQVTEEEYGSFIGQLSQLSPEIRAEVISKMKAHPDKVAEAMQKASLVGKEVCL